MEVYQFSRAVLRAAENTTDARAIKDAVCEELNIDYKVFEEYLERVAKGESYIKVALSHSSTPIKELGFRKRIRKNQIFCFGKPVYEIAAWEDRNEIPYHFKPVKWDELEPGDIVYIVNPGVAGPYTVTGRYYMRAGFTKPPMTVFYPFDNLAKPGE